MPMFGKTTDGTQNSASSANRVWVSQATPSSTGAVQTGHARLWLTAAGSTSVKFAIYANSGSAPGALLAESDALTLTSTTEAERVFTFSGANRITVASGTAYWIGPAWQDPDPVSNTVSVAVSRDNTAAQRPEQAITSWPTLPDPFGTPANTTTGPIDAYVTYSTDPIYDPPGAAFDLTNWKITLPTDGSDGGTTADEITQPALSAYADANFLLDASDQMVMTAPARGATTSGSGGTRSELREMEDGAEADWDFATTGYRRLTVTETVSPTTITGGTQPRKETICGQIHGASGTPPIYLSVEHTTGVGGTTVTPRLQLYRDQASSVTVLSPLSTAGTTEITYRIEISGGRLKLWAAIGDVTALPADPFGDWAASEFTDNTHCYLKAGAYNKSLAANNNNGASVVTISHLELIQPGDVVTHGKAGGAAAAGAGSGAQAVTSATAYAKAGGAAGVGSGSGAREYVRSMSGGAAALAAGSAARAYVRSRTGGAAALGAGSAARSLDLSRSGGAAASGAGSGVRSLSYARTGGAAAAGAGSGAVEIITVTIHDKSGGAAALGAGAGARTRMSARAGGAGALAAGAGTQSVTPAAVHVRTGGAAALGAATGHAATGGSVEYSKTGGAAVLGAGSGVLEVQYPATHAKAGSAAAVAAGAGIRQVIRTRTGGASASGAGSGAAERVPAAVHARTGGAGALGAGAGLLAYVPATVHTRTGGAAARGAGSGAALVDSPDVYVKTGGGAARGAAIALLEVIPPAVYLRTGGAVALGAGSGRAKRGGALHAGPPRAVGQFHVDELVTAGQLHAGTPVAVGQLHAGPEAIT